MRPTERRARLTGRSSATFLQLPHFVINSPQWAELSGNEVKLLIEIAAQYNGSNNGDLSYPRSKAIARGWRGSATVSKAISSLQEKGWLLLTRQGGRTGCSLYAVTFFAMDESNKHPYSPERKPSHLWKCLASNDSQKIRIACSKTEQECVQKLNKKINHVQKLNIKAVRVRTQVIG